MPRVGTIADLPGPRGLPIMGSALGLIPVSRAHLAMEGWSQRYGPIFRVRAAGRLIIGVADPDAIDEILRDRPGGYRRWSDQRDRIIEMGKGPPGVFVAEGDSWQRQRRLVVASLNIRHLQRFFGEVRLSTERLRRRLLPAATGFPSLAIGDDLSAYTTDVISALAFGHNLNTLEENNGELHDHIRTVLGNAARRIVSPVPYWRWVRLPADRAFDRSMAEVYRAIERFIVAAQQRLAARPELRSAPENLLEAMLVRQGTDGSFTDEEIANNALNLLVAGEDTTSHTLAWTMWLLAKDPSAQERLAAQVARVLGSDRIAMDHSTIGRLEYVKAVFQESMRLKNAVPAIVVEPVTEKVVCGTRIPAGTKMVLLTREACRQTADRDSDKFKPERWLDDKSNAPKPKSLSFGAGARFCPGHNLAYLEAISALAMIARNFEWELDETGDPVRESIGNGMAPRGLRIRIGTRLRHGTH